MPNRKTYDVSPGDNGWGVKARGAKRASGRFDTKKEAVERGRDLAKKAQEGQVVIRKQDGTIQEERTYRDDPYPPKG
jgi:uncharacterized protein YdaT